MLYSVRPVLCSLLFLITALILCFIKFVREKLLASRALDNSFLTLAASTWLAIRCCWQTKSCFLKPSMAEQNFVNHPRWIVFFARMQIEMVVGHQMCGLFSSLCNNRFFSIVIKTQKCWCHLCCTVAWVFLCSCTFHFRWFSYQTQFFLLKSFFQSLLEWFCCVSSLVDFVRIQKQPGLLALESSLPILFWNKMHVVPEITAQFTFSVFIITTNKGFIATDEICVLDLSMLPHTEI